MKKILAILSLFLFLVPLMSLASPVPLAYIINDESKECAVHRGGDECVSHPIPEGWRYTGLARETVCQPDILKLMLKLIVGPFGVFIVLCHLVQVQIIQLCFFGL